MNRRIFIRTVFVGIGSIGFISVACQSTANLISPLQNAPSTNIEDENGSKPNYTIPFISLFCLTKNNIDSSTSTLFVEIAVNNPPISQDNKIGYRFEGIAINDILLQKNRDKRKNIFGHDGNGYIWDSYICELPFSQIVNNNITLSWNDQGKRISRSFVVAAPCAIPIISTIDRTAFRGSVEKALVTSLNNSEYGYMSWGQVGGASENSGGVVNVDRNGKLIPAGATASYLPGSYILRLSKLQSTPNTFINDNVTLYYSTGTYSYSSIIIK